MASRTRRNRRNQPYDLDNPTNWTSAQLKTKLAKFGVKLTSSIPKTVLRQLYEQLSAQKNQLVQCDVTSNVNNGLDTDQAVFSGLASTSDMNLGINNDILTSETNQTAPNELTLNDLSASRTSSITETAHTVPTPTTLGSTESASLFQSTLGIVSSMQNAISALQGTINTLIQKQAVSDSTNHLKDFYKDKSTNQNNGVAADELPHIDVVTDSVRKNIVTGKYVNLACLLIPDFDAPSVSYDTLNGLEILKKDKRDHRLDRALSITQFFKAFGIYKRVMCEAFPLRRSELDLYEADIGNIFEHYGDIFYQYHVQFSKRAAAYMEKGIKIDWSKRHKDLFQLLVGGAKTKFCEHCLQVDHQSPFCPSQINQPLSTNTKKTIEGQKVNSRPDPHADKIGRQRIFHQGREICNNFNANGCYRPSCSYSHICKKCKRQGHGENVCKPAASTSTNEQSKNESEKSKTKISG